KEIGRNSHEQGVDIRLAMHHMAHRLGLRRILANLKIRWIKYGPMKGCRWTITEKTGLGVCENKIVMLDLELHLMSGGMQCLLALNHGAFENGQQFRIVFP